MARPTRLPITLIPERTDDAPRIRELLLASFPSAGEADLVDELRAADALPVSLIAFEGDIPLGHIGFSPVRLLPQPRAGDVFALAPLAVAASARRRGIGTALVRSGLRACREAGCESVVVLGDYKFYRRFGFRYASLRGLSCMFDVPQEAFLLAELRQDAFPFHRATVYFHDAFHRFAR